MPDPRHPVGHGPDPDRKGWAPRPGHLCHSAPGNRPGAEPNAQPVAGPRPRHLRLSRPGVTVRVRSTPFACCQSRPQASGLQRIAHVIRALLGAVTGLVLAACAGAPGPNNGNVFGDPVASAAFSTFQSLCIENLNSPEKAVAQAASAPKSQKVGGGEVHSEVMIDQSGVYSCIIAYKPGDVNLAIDRLLLGVRYFSPAPERQTCANAPGMLACRSDLNGTPVRSVGVRALSDGFVALAYLKFPPLQR